jgi:Tol biopolymer transport system component
MLIKPQVIARGPVFMPASSQDGAVLAWSNRLDGTRDIFIQRDGETQRVTTDSEVDSEPTLTPDGEILIWSRRTEDSWDLYEATSDGVVSPFLTDPGPQRKPRFSTDGSTLVFEDRGGIGVMKDGRREWIAKAKGNEQSQRPRVNHDGTRVFWERFDAQTRTTSLWMRDQHGAEKQLLTPDDSWTGYSFDKEGEKVTFSVWSEAGDEDLKVLDLATNTVSDLANKEGVSEVFPSVSPDGESTFYNIIDYRKNPEVTAYIFRDKNGEKEELVTRDLVGRDLFPQATPDGGKLHWMWIDNQDPNNRALMQADV